MCSWRVHGKVKTRHFYILHRIFFFFLQSSSYVKIMLDLLINFRKYRSSSQKEFHKCEQAKHGDRSCTDSLILMRLQDQTGPLVLVKTRAGPSDRKGT